jgi:hypothetical protein
MTKLTGLMVVVLASIASQAYAQDWTNYPSSAFPAKVRAVVFSDGVLSPEKSMRWGQWTVRFEPATAAFLVGPFNGANDAVVIKTLECTNSVIGKVGCRIRLVWNPAGVRFCALDSENTGDMITGIQCPVSLQLRSPD